jgi:hypothetical protein
LGNRKKQNKGRGKKKKGNSSSQKKSIHSKESTLQSNLELTTSPSKQEKNKPWYISKLMKALYIGIISSGIVALIFYLIQSCESEKTILELKMNEDNNRYTVVDTIKTSTDTVLSSIDIYNRQILENLKKNQNEVLSLFKQPLTKEEYEKDKAIQQKQSEAFQDSLQKVYDFKLDSLRNDILNGIIRDIAYINYPEWSRFFDLGFSLFRIDLDGKLYITVGSYNLSAVINWSSLKLTQVTDSKINISIPDIAVYNPYIYLYSNELAIERNFEKLNSIPLTQFNYSHYVNCYSGIISDNKDGIVGIVGFSKNPINETIKQTVDFDKLERITQIDFNNKRN